VKFPIGEIQENINITSKLSKDQINHKLYDENFYKRQIHGSLESAKEYSKYLSNLFNLKSVIDFGCGRGTWLKGFEQIGINKLVGLDGSWNNQGKILSKKIIFKPIDLNKEIKIEEKFDLALSLEVAEHLKPTSSELFIKSITSSSDLIMFGAAFSGQPGTNHINTRPHSFWANIFADYSFKVYDIFRPKFCGNNKIKPWYQQNTFLYVKAGSKYEKALKEKNFYPIENIHFLDLIHPWLYGHYLNKYISIQKGITNNSNFPPPTK
tara:strand:- start:49 stop:846 length:798 start_codon:yes stop_codon:yes gene_type:complete